MNGFELEERMYGRIVQERVFLKRVEKPAQEILNRNRWKASPRHWPKSLTRFNRFDPLKV